MSFNALEYLTELVNDTATDEWYGMTFEEVISWLDKHDLRYDFEERAGILENDGGLTREDADQQALREIWVRIQRIEQ